MWLVEIIREPYSRVYTLRAVLGVAGPPLLRARTAWTYHGARRKALRWARELNSADPQAVVLERVTAPGKATRP